MEKKRKKETRPSLAPGLDDEKILEIKATREEIEDGDYTMVTKLTYDEVDPTAK